MTAYPPGFRALAGAVSVCGLVFVVSRAVTVPLTYDEAAAYLRFISTDVLSVFNFHVATNHVLHTILTRLFHAAAGDSEIVLRLPGVIGYALYSWFAFLILSGLKHRVIAAAGFILLHVNPYVLDFFALSRGYGLSLGFLMGALYFLFRFLARRSDARNGGRELSRSLVLAGAAVMANFPMLNAYLAIVAVAVVSLVASTARVSGTPSDVPEHPGPRRSWTWLIAGVAVVFIVGVFSQNVDLSGRLYEPVAVRIAGPVDTELDGVKVLRVDLRGRTARLTRRGNEWSADAVIHFSGLRIELPQALVARIGSIDVAVGDRVFRDGPGPSERWNSFDRGRIRVLESTSGLSLATPRNAAFHSIINWAGERRYLSTVAQYAGVCLLLLAAVALTLDGLGRLAVRFGFLRTGEWRPIRSSVVCVAAFAGPPLYVLNRRGELYYGGTTGLIQDTFRSLIDRSLYDRTYHEAQIAIVLSAIGLSVAAAALLVYLNYRRRTLQTVIPLLAVSSILLLVSAALVTHGALFDTPYLSGRTALLYIPLYVIFIAFLFDGIAELGRLLRGAAIVGLSAVLLLSVYHFASTANLRYTLDWRDDASTKMMVADLGDVVARQRSTAPRVSLGVEPMYFPVAVFYAARSKAADIHIEVLPSSSRVDYEYLSVINERPSMRVIARYRLARSLLAEAEQ